MPNSNEPENKRERNAFLFILIVNKQVNEFCDLHAFMLAASGSQRTAAFSEVKHRIYPSIHVYTYFSFEDSG